MIWTWCDPSGLAEPDVAVLDVGDRVCCGRRGGRQPQQPAHREHANGCMETLLGCGGDQSRAASSTRHSPCAIDSTWIESILQTGKSRGLSVARRRTRESGGRPDECADHRDGGRQRPPGRRTIRGCAMATSSVGYSSLASKPTVLAAEPLEDHRGRAAQGCAAPIRLGQISHAEPPFRAMALAAGTASA